MLCSEIQVFRCTIESVLILGAVRYYGLPDMRFHDIRHSTASILYDAGWELKDIQEWLGHSDIETTGNIYTHISKIRKEKKGMELAGTFRL